MKLGTELQDGPVNSEGKPIPNLFYVPQQTGPSHNVFEDLASPVGQSRDFIFALKYRKHKLKQYKSFIPNSNIFIYWNSKFQ